MVPFYGPTFAPLSQLHNELDLLSLQKRRAIKSIRNHFRGKNFQLDSPVQAVFTYSVVIFCFWENKCHFEMSMWKTKNGGLH